MSRRLKQLAPTLLLLLGLALAQEAPRYLIPGVSGSASAGAITVTGPAGSFTHVAGVGWIVPLAAAPPALAGGAVIGDLALARALGVDAPAVADVRFGGSGEIRVVLDIAGLDSAAALGLSDRSGRTTEGEALTVTLPPLLLPVEPLEPYGRLEAALRSVPGGVQLELSGTPFHYRLFTLDTPVRVVIDAIPNPVTAEALERTLAPGVVYRRFSAPTPVGATTVHLVEIAPGAAELRVVGEPRQGANMTELAAGGVAAINAGYFDPDTFDPIGLFRIDFGLLGLPSRNRAAVAFSAGGTVIDRVYSEVGVRVEGRLTRAPSDALRVSAADGVLVGRPDEGVITLQQGRVLSNTVGPARVPPDGSAIIYDPALRDLALADAGDRIGLEVDMDPSAFGQARYAVEAGPLLLRGGSPDFQPEIEAFERGRRILDAYTQQAAIGVRADGTTLLLVAEQMRAEDLIPLFTGLGAESAMRLDSGSSAALVVDGETVNASVRRRVVNAIVAVVAPTGAVRPVAGPR